MIIPVLSLGMYVLIVKQKKERKIYSLEKCVFYKTQGFQYH